MSETHTIDTVLLGGRTVKLLGGERRVERFGAVDHYAVVVQDKDNNAQIGWMVAAAFDAAAEPVSAIDLTSVSIEEFQRNPEDYQLSYCRLIGWTLKAIGSQISLCLPHDDAMEALALLNPKVKASK